MSIREFQELIEGPSDNERRLYEVLRLLKGADPSEVSDDVEPTADAWWPWR